MSATNRTIGIKAEVKKAGKKAEFSPLMEALTRVGYGVRGLIYITMGLLAARVALGKGGALASPLAAIAEIGKQPAGMVLLWVVLLGLVSYTLWGVVRALLDPLHKGNDMKGLVERCGFLVSAFGYAILILPTYGYIKGSSLSSSGSQTQKLITSIMVTPWGRWAIGIIGLVVLAVVGGLISFGAYRANPSQPIGMDTALATLLHQPYGIWLLGIVAVGLIAFGFYSMLSALWFRFKRQV